MNAKADIAAVKKAFSSFILSASGWRKVFAEGGDEESGAARVSDEDKILCALAAECFARLVKARTGKRDPDIVLATDTRPTGPEIARAAEAAFRHEGARVAFAGVAAAPEIMAYARFKDAFAYISASHNPIGHNGLKFGLSSGGILSAEDSSRLIEDFAAAAKDIKRIDAAAGYLSAFDFALEPCGETKAKMLMRYAGFAREVITGFGGDGQEGAAAVFDALRSEARRMAKRGARPAVFADFNGGARALSIDRKFIEEAGISFFCMNEKPGAIAHGIIPEGDNLLPAAREMRRLRDSGAVAAASAFIGYAPDCDGDRGNIIFWNERAGKMQPLEAQDVFALAVVAELSYMEYAGPSEGARLAVVANDPTSMRVDRIAEAFGAKVARAEVGEANVVSLARKLRGEGKAVRIFGEGSNGGNITWPSAVRDPLATVFAILKLLLLKGGKSRPGPFRIWLRRVGMESLYKDDFTLADVMATIPAFATTPVSSKEAKMDIRAKDHAELKRAFQRIFLEEWEAKRDELRAAGIADWIAVRNNGIEEAECGGDFGESGKGGLKVIFLDETRKTKAFFWMRGSGTEPAFRVLADAEGKDNPLERELLLWLRSMLERADRSL